MLTLHDPAFSKHEQIMHNINIYQMRRWHYSFMLQSIEYLPDSPACNYERAIYIFLWNWSHWKLTHARLARANALGDRESKSVAMRDIHSAATAMRQSYKELRDIKAKFKRSKIRLIKSA